MNGKEDRFQNTDFRIRMSFIFAAARIGHG